jgi:LacI family transcriptional regulator
MAVTIKDVALKARVSIASVSRALNGTGTVTRETRERVLRAAQQLRYTPHQAARSLITRRTRTIGVLLPDLHGEYFSELIRGIDKAARELGLHLLVSSSHGDSAEARLALESMNGRVDGVLIMSSHVDSQLVHGALTAALPAVHMNMPSMAGDSPTFVTDHFGGARTLVQHFVSLGYRRIAHITGPEGNWDAEERLRGYQAVLARGSGADELIVRGDFSEESGYLAGRRLLALAPRPDAVFAGNDMMAIGCLYAFTEAGLRVPDDIAIGGFDDIPISRYVTPALTTVRAQTTELGRQALSALAQSISSAGTGKGQRTVLDTQLVLRDSCHKSAIRTPER